jgi:hypothetical protein
VSAERSWGADTVAFRRPREAVTPDPPPRRCPPRGPRRSLPRPVNRTIALAAVGIVALVGLIAILCSGSGSSLAPIREVAEPAPRVVVKTSKQLRRREQRHNPKPGLKRSPKGQLESRAGEPQRPSPTTHERAAPELEPAPVVEAESEAAPVGEAEPKPIAEPPPAPTSPAAEFGL